MKVILKILLAPVIAALAIIIWIFALILSLSAWVFGILGTVFGILGLITLLFINTTNGIIILVFGTSDAGSVDDWTDAEIPLFRAGCNLRITQLPTNLVESKNGRVWLRLYSSFYIEGGE